MRKRCTGGAIGVRCPSNVTPLTVRLLVVVQCPSMSAGPDTLEYAPRTRPALPRAVVKVAVLVALALACPFLLYFAANGYASMKYGGTKVGMTRTKVDRHLWAFASRPVAYQGAGAGQSVVRYELLWFGKGASIQVIYDASGIVVDPQPIFDN
jgi:hypothetical protein